LKEKCFSLTCTVKKCRSFAIPEYLYHSQQVRDYNILLVDDFEGFRSVIRAALQARSNIQITEASDGLEAVRKAEELQPDLILLDIELPGLNGLEVARRVRTLAPAARILFLSVESDPSLVREALSLGACYIHKPHLNSDLLPAIDAVLRGEQFVSRNLGLNGRMDAPCRHEILFCSDDEVLLDGLVGFIAAALKAANAAIVWATDSHRAHLRQRLYGQGVDVDSAIQRGTYISLDVSEPAEPQRILIAMRSLSDAASRMGKTNPRVAVCGERAGRLWAEGKTDAALNIEKLLNEFAKSHNIDILCVYPVPQHEADDAFKSLCAQHTAAYSR
jgi:CheY-like chemotaxis protein